MLQNVPGKCAKRMMPQRRPRTVILLSATRIKINQDAGTQKMLRMPVTMLRTALVVLRKNASKMIHLPSVRKTIVTRPVRKKLSARLQQTIKNVTGMPQTVLKNNVIKMPSLHIALLISVRQMLVKKPRVVLHHLMRTSVSGPQMTPKLPVVQEESATVIQSSITARRLIVTKPERIKHGAKLLMILTSATGMELTAPKKFALKIQPLPSVLPSGVTLQMERKMPGAKPQLMLKNAHGMPQIAHMTSARTTKPETGMLIALKPIAKHTRQQLNALNHLPS
jgi:hypothetical protein